MTDLNRVKAVLIPGLPLIPAGPGDLKFRERELLERIGSFSGEALAHWDSIADEALAQRDLYQESLIAAKLPGPRKVIEGGNRICPLDRDPYGIPEAFVIELRGLFIAGWTGSRWILRTSVARHTESTRRWNGSEDGGDLLHWARVMKGEF